MVVVLFAGILAQQMFCPSTPDARAENDFEQINQYLESIFPNNGPKQSMARDCLKLDSGALVEKHREAINKVAEALAAKVPQSGRRTLRAPELIEILHAGNIDDDSVECSDLHSRITD
jgi:hypothetical protein